MHKYLHVPSYICAFFFLEIDLDVDDLLPFQVDKLNVLALEYGVQPGAYSKSVEHCYNRKLSRRKSFLDNFCPPQEYFSSFPYACTLCM